MNEEKIDLFSELLSPIAKDMKSIIFIFCALLLIISAKHPAFAENNSAYKYPDLNKNIVGMQPIIEEEDFTPKGRRIPNAEQTTPKTTIKQTKQQETQTPKATVIKPPSAIAEIKADITIAIESEFTEETIENNNELSNYISALKKNKSKDIKIHSVGSIGDDKSISTAKRRALSHALLLRQYLIDQNISSTRIDMNIEATKTTSNENDFIEIY